MLGKMVSIGFGIATLPARMTWRGAKTAMRAPGDIGLLLEELRDASDDIAREIQIVLGDIDAEMSRKTAHLSPQQKQQAAEMAMDAAEQHLSMAAVNMLRALWLAVDSSRRLAPPRRPVTIEHEPQEPGSA